MAVLESIAAKCQCGHYGKSLSHSFDKNFREINDFTRELVFRLEITGIYSHAFLAKIS